jgi:hypothetical protein
MLGVRIMKAADGSPKINETSEIDFSENTCELTATRQVKNSDGDTKVDDVGTLVHRLSETPGHEIECLVGKLMEFHKKLQSDGIRIQFDIENYADLNQRVMQLTTIVADSVGKLPAPRVD